MLSEKERKRVGASNENVGGALAAIVGIAGAQPRGDCLRQHVRMVAAFDAAAGGAARRAHPRGSRSWAAWSQKSRAWKSSPCLRATTASVIGSPSSSGRYRPMISAQSASASP
jgi:hypothetical protein